MPKKTKAPEVLIDVKKFVKQLNARAKDMARDAKSYARDREYNIAADFKTLSNCYDEVAKTTENGMTQKKLLKEVKRFAKEARLDLRACKSVENYREAADCLSEAELFEGLVEEIEDGGYNKTV